MIQRSTNEDDEEEEELQAWLMKMKIKFYTLKAQKRNNFIYQKQSVM